MMADFAGVPAHKYETEPAVEGEAFWEHSSELKQTLKGMEVRTGANPAGAPPEHSFLWIAGELIPMMDLPELTVKKYPIFEVKTQAEDEVQTKVIGGPIARSSKDIDERLLR